MCRISKSKGSDPSVRWPRAAGPAGSQPPNEGLSPQGSVEAQCGLVLNGQGGVIRRGKAPHVWRPSPYREAANAPRHDTTRPDPTRPDRTRPDTTRQRAANRRDAPVLSAVSTLKQGRTRCRAPFNAPLPPPTVTHKFFLSFFLSSGGN